MGNERDTDRLARYVMRIAVMAVVLLICWYFRNVLVYIIAAFVVSLIGHPIMNLMRKLRIKGKHAPDWLLSVLTIIIIIGLLLLVITQAVPIVTGIIADASLHAWNSGSNMNPLAVINDWLIERFPSLGADFDVFVLLTDKLQELTSFDNVSGFIGSVTSMVVGTVVALFSVIFISFFLSRTRTFSVILSGLWFRTKLKSRWLRP